MDEFKKHFDNLFKLAEMEVVKANEEKQLAITNANREVETAKAERDRDVAKANAERDMWQNKYNAQNIFSWNWIRGIAGGLSPIAVEEHEVTLSANHPNTSPNVDPCSESEHSLHIDEDVLSDDNNNEENNDDDNGNYSGEVAHDDEAGPSNGRHSVISSSFQFPPVDKYGCRLNSIRGIHYNIREEDGMYVCMCGKEKTKYFNLNAHIKTKHKPYVKENPRQNPSNKRSQKK